MIKRTHLAIAIGLMLYFLPIVNNKLAFVSVILVASLLPDIDTSGSYFGQRWYWRPVQWVTKHRGVLHSMTICIFISLIFALFIPILAFPFFLGYSSHLIGDALTQDGIMPFWPLKKEAKWIFRTGGKREMVLFLIVLGIDVLLFFRLFA
ncbi:MAG: metal-dependent hydrolase [Candidatus Pacearchaeota archaeon]|nr:metal-dependent hydrolase [Candidatus Pacearchaeota archaeon]